MSRAEMSRYPSLTSRFDDADREVLPRFLEADQQALGAQFRHRQIRLVLIIGSPLVVVLGSLQIVLGVRWVSVGTFVVALMTATALRAERKHPEKIYRDSQHRAERLRSLYFRYVAGLEEMTPDGLREAVADVCRDVSVSEKTPKVIEPAQPGSAAEFIALYQNHRIADQSYWFSYRHAEYATSVERIRTFNEGQILTAGALGLISVIWPAVSVATGVTIAILGGAVTALSSWAKELRFDELTETYAKAAAELASLEIPEPDDTPAVARWVTHVERVLLPETGTPSEDMIPAGELGRLDERVTALEAGLGGRAGRTES